jgi:uncharacterized protein
MADCYYDPYMEGLARELTDNLEKWRNYTSRSPLVLRGARQVGKTYLVQKFAKSSFANLAYANFEHVPNLANCFTSLSSKQIISALELELNQDITPGKTLLFLDEIQECPKAIMALRYFKEEIPELHVIAAGSLLEFVLNDSEFRMPVGRIEYMYVKPLSFNEFLVASDKVRLVDYVKSYKLTDPVQDAAHKQLLQICQEYMAIGGMPAVVAEYVHAQNLNRCEELLSDLIIAYRDDFGKYAKKTEHKYLQKLYDKAPSLVAKWFKYVKVDEDIHPRNIRVALDLLSQASIISRVYATSGVGIPLASTQNDKKFKLIFLDTGLVRAAQQINLRLIYQPKLELLNKGHLTEQFVGQELLVYAPKVQQNKIYFWQREQKGAQAEVDYLYTHNGEIYPLEVKAGSIGRLKSLKIFMQEKKSKLGIRISQSPLSFEQNILSVPFYMISEIPRLIDSAI